jgi:beta-lactamase regulating signal transducer with metallopeptidase domain/thiol-disulfide isomerase/thioredoxin
MNPTGFFGGGVAQFSTLSAWAVLLWKATLLLAFAWLIHFALARANPRWRIFIWRGVAVGLALLAVWAVALPGLTVRISAPEQSVRMPSSSFQRISAENDSRAILHTRRDSRKFHDIDGMTAHDYQTPIEIQPGAVRLVESLMASMSLRSVFLVIWGIGMAALIIRLAIGYVRLAILLKDSRPASKTILAEIQRIASILGCRGDVDIHSSRHFNVPFLYGLLRPVVILPERMCENSRHTQLMGILAHELAHTRSFDLLWNAVMQAISIVLWFHPLAWRLGSAHRAACDAVCDAISASFIGDVHAYCRTLASVALEARNPIATAGLAMARVCDVRRRLAVLKRNIFTSPLKRRTVALMMVVGLSALSLLAGLRFALAEAPSSKEKAAELMRAVYDSVAWLDSAKSFYITTEYKVSITDDELRWEEKHPSFGMSGKPDPRPYCTSDEFAWDETRIRSHNKSHYEGDNKMREFTKVWDGLQAVEYSQSDDHKQYVLGNKIKPFFNESKIVAIIPWQPEGKHRLAIEDFELEGQETINGRPCYALLSRAAHYRKYVGVADKRLYRSIWYSARDGKAGYDRMALCQKFSGPSIKTFAHWDAWLAGLPPEKQKEIRRQFAIAEFEFACPILSETWDDYREAAPGCWMPFKQTHNFFNLDSTNNFLSSYSDRTVKEVTINKPLDKALFHIELVDGVFVATDWRYDPIIRYTYRSDMTEAERLAMCEAEQAKQAEGDADLKKRQVIINGRLGQAPPPLPGSGWINSEPLSWEKLRGKVVLLHFWEANCGPCWNELPILARWHENLSKNDAVIIIGIHPPTDELDAVRKKLDQFQVKYPVLIDAKPTQSGGRGLMHDWFGNPWWPHTVLVSKQGLIAGHGNLLTGDINEQMRKLEIEETPPQASDDKAATATAQKPPNAGPVSLADAVSAINQLAAKTAETRALKPLTEDDVIKVIKELNHNDWISGEEYQEIKRIAETRRLPKNIILRQFMRLYDDTSVEHGWWVRLIIMRDNAAPSSITIRQEPLFQRPYTQKERMFHEETRQNGIPTMGRLVAYFDDDPKFNEVQTFSRQEADRLADAVKKALSDKKTDDLLNAYDWERVDKETRASVRKEAEQFMKRQLPSVSVSPRRFGGNLMHWQGAKTMEPNLPVLGYIVLDFADEDVPSSVSLEFGQTKDGARLVNYIVTKDDFTRLIGKPFSGPFQVRGYTMMHPEKGWYELFDEIVAPDEFAILRNANFEIWKIHPEKYVPIPSKANVEDEKKASPPADGKNKDAGKPNDDKVKEDQTNAAEDSSKTGFRPMVIQVSDTEGKPLAGADITVSGSNDSDIESFKYKTDAGGKATIDAPRKDVEAYFVDVAKSGYVTACAEWGYRKNDVPIPDTFAFALEPGTDFGGFVRDEQGKPVAGVQISIWGEKSLPNEIRRQIINQEVTTDAEGKWRIDSAPKDPSGFDMNVTLKHPEFGYKSFGARELPVAELYAQKATLTLRKGAYVEGIVTYPDGKPAAGATVGLYAEHSGSDCLKTKSDENGHYRIVASEPGEYTVAASADGFVPGWKEFTVVKDGKTVDLKLGKGESIRLRVVDQQGKPVPGAKIGFVLEAGAKNWEKWPPIMVDYDNAPQNARAYRTPTDAEGRWSMLWVPGNQITLYVEKKGYVNAQASFAPDEREQVITLEAGEWSVAGQVIDQQTKAPIKEFWVIEGWEMSDNIGWNERRLVSNENGQYHVEWSRREENRAIRIEADGYYPSETKFLGDRKQTTFNVELKKGENIIGIVRSPDGKPLANADVALCIRGGECYVRNGKILPTRRSLVARTGSDGRFSFPPQNDHFILIVTHELGFAQVYELKELKEITLQSWARVEGAVPVDGKQTSVILLNNLTPLPASEERIASRISYDFEPQIDEKGHFVLQRVQPGRAELIRMVNSAQPGSSQTWTPTQKTQIEVAPGQTLKIDFPVNSERWPAPPAKRPSSDL